MCKTLHNFKEIAKVEVMFGNVFYRTSLEYWQSSTLNYTWYWILAVFLGWAGLDMFYLRSPVAGILKIFLNVFTLGYYWFYDAMEATFNKDQIQLSGPMMPFYGPIGLAGGQFMGTGSPGQKDKHYTFLLYGFIVVFAGIFGGDSFLVGDKLSGYIRLIALCSIIFSPIAIIWWIYKLYLYFIRNDQLLDQNYEYFGAPEPADASLKCPNVLEQFTAWGVDTTGVVLEYIPILGKFAPFFRGLATSLRIAYGITRQAVDTAITVTKTLPGAIDKVSDASRLNPSEVQATVAQQTTPPTISQKGGAEDATSMLGTLALMATVAFIVFSSFTLNLWRSITGKNGVKTEDAERKDKRSDDPPKPGTVRSTP